LDVPTSYPKLDEPEEPWHEASAAVGCSIIDARRIRFGMWYIRITLRKILLLVVVEGQVQV
jgi:hypothetical protein